MKINLLIAAVIVMAVVACNKDSQHSKLSNTVPTYSPMGKWVSVAYFNGTTWVNDPMAHHFEFNQDNSFIFRDHNAANCTGQFIVTAANNNTITIIKFQNPDCGLTDRRMDRLINDTIMLTVIAPPNITQGMVKYVKEP